MAQTLRQSASHRAHETTWPDMFVNLQTAYTELTRAQFELERRGAEIAAERDLFLEVIESMSEAWFLMDRTGRVVRVNPAASALLECQATEMLGRSLAIHQFACISGRSADETPGFSGCATTASVSSRSTASASS